MSPSTNICVPLASWYPSDDEDALWQTVWSDCQRQRQLPRIGPDPPNVIKLDDSNDGYLVIPYSVITPHRPHLVPPEPRCTRQDQSMSALATFLILF